MHQNGQSSGLQLKTCGWEWAQCGGYGHKFGETLARPGARPELSTWGVRENRTTRPIASAPQGGMAGSMFCRSLLGRSVTAGQPPAAIACAPALAPHVYLSSPVGTDYVVGTCGHVNGQVCGHIQSVERVAVLSDAEGSSENLSSPRLLARRSATLRGCYWASTALGQRRFLAQEATIDE
jgi:hypothetical protein